MRGHVRDPLSDIELGIGHAGQHAASLHAHVEHRIIRQRRRQRAAHFGRKRGERIQRRHAHQRISVGQGRLQARHGRRAGVVLQFLDGGRAGNDRRGGVTGQRGEQRRRAGLALTSGVECLDEMLETLSFRSVRLLDGISRPLRTLVRMTIGAGVGHAELHRQVGSRHADGMIRPRIDHHVVPGRHMTGHALRTRPALLMHGVRAGVVHLGRVAALAQGVALCTCLAGVRVVAIAAGHTTAYILYPRNEAYT